MAPAALWQRGRASCANWSAQRLLEPEEYRPCWLGLELNGLAWPHAVCRLASGRKRAPSNSTPGAGSVCGLHSALCGPCGPRPNLPPPVASGGWLQPFPHRSREGVVRGAGRLTGCPEGPVPGGASAALNWAPRVAALHFGPSHVVAPVSWRNAPDCVREHWGHVRHHCFPARSSAGRKRRGGNDRDVKGT